jgi:uncharacterized C2H2 Zn-finger protein
MPALYRLAATGSLPPTLPKEDEPAAVGIEETCDWCSWTSADQTLPGAHTQGQHPLDAIMPCEQCDRLFQKQKALILHISDAHVAEAGRTKLLEHYAEQHKAMHQKADLLAEVRVEELREAAREAVRKAAHEEIVQMHEQKRIFTQQQINLAFEKLGETKDECLAEVDRWRIVLSQREREIMETHGRGLEMMSQQKAEVDQTIDNWLQRAQENLDSTIAGLAGELRSEDSPQREIHENHDSDQRAKDAVLPKQETADTEDARILDRLSEREKHIIKRMDETAQRHQEVENAEHARRLEGLSQREGILIKEHERRIQEARKAEIVAQEAQFAAGKAQLEARFTAERAQLDAQLAQSAA